VIVTLALTLFASWAWGFTLNRVSLFALIFSIGILVDDAIVVVENIHRHMAMGEYLATVPEVTDYQGYAGTAAPINFNGLVRQYYLREGANVGDLQVNLLDKHERHRQSHAIALSVRGPLQTIARRYGGNAKIVEIPPGPPVLSPLVAEVYGIDYDGQIRIAHKVRKVFGSAPDIVDVDDSVEYPSRKLASDWRSQGRPATF
jgi:multidrug efflux pump subunit AcrB